MISLTTCSNETLTTFHPYFTCNTGSVTVTSTRDTGRTTFGTERNSAEGRLYLPDVPFTFGDDRLRGLAMADGQILPFRIDFDGRPYNSLTNYCTNYYSVLKVYKKSELMLMRRTTASVYFCPQVVLVYLN